MDRSHSPPSDIGTDHIPADPSRFHPSDKTTNIVKDGYNLADLELAAHADRGPDTTRQLLGALF
jgi:hypothetical protein